MKQRIRNLFSSSKIAFKSWWEKDPFRQSAVIAYYAIFSLPGLLVVIIAIAGYFFNKENVSDQIIGQIRSTLGANTAQQVEEIISATSDLGGSVWAVIIGVGTILFGATTVFAQFQKSLNIIWEVKASKEKSGILQLLKVRLFSFGLIISIAFILLISLVVSSVITAMSNWVLAHLPDYLVVFFHLLNFLISLAIISFLFALMFKYFPDAKIYWRDVWSGAIVTALLFVLGEFALGFYFGKAHPGKGYGAAGSVILILLWTSYSSMIVFYGAEFTKAFAQRHRQHISPKETAKKETGRES